MIIQNEPDRRGRRAEMSFTVPRADLRDARAPRSTRSRRELGISSVAEDPDDGQGLGRRRGHEVAPGVAAKVFETLGDQGINIEMISTSPIKISCVVTADARRPTPCARCTRRSSSAPTHDRAPSTRSEPQQHECAARRRRRRHRRRRHRHARDAARARLPRARDRPVRLRALGRPRARRRAARPRAQPTRRSRASTSRCSRAGAHDLARVGAAVRRGRRRRWSTTLARAARTPRSRSSSPRSTRRRSSGHQGLIANPNCSTMQLMVALKPIHDAAGIERLIVSTYQSVSGTGVKARRGARGPDPRASLHGEELPDAAVYPHPIAFNVLRRRRQLRRRRRPHRRRAQDDVRDAQDPRRRVDRDRRHVRARAGHATRTRSRSTSQTRATLSRRGGARRCWRPCPG